MHTRRSRDIKISAVSSLGSALAYSLAAARRCVAEPALDCVMQSQTGRPEWPLLGVSEVVAAHAISRVLRILEVKVGEFLTPSVTTDAPVHTTPLEKFNGVAFGKKLCGSIASSGQTRRSRDTDNLILSMNDRTLRDARPSFG